MYIKTIYLILISLLLLISCNQKPLQNTSIIETEWNSENIVEVFEHQKIVADTITNWQFYKDSTLVFRSNITDSKRLVTEINFSDHYEYFNFKIFYDFNNQIMERKIDLIHDGKVFASFTDKNRSHYPFSISKKEMDHVIRTKIGKEIHMNYYDSIIENGMIVGTLKFIDK